MTYYLIIEDDPVWQQKLIDDLDTNNEEKFHTAETLDKAKSFLQENVYDAVFVDLRLANEQTPFESLGKIVFILKSETKRTDKITPLIVVTGYPVTLQDLIKAINAYRGWIWGWHKKSNYDGEQIRNTILSINKSKNSQVATMPQESTSSRETFIQRFAEDYHQITLGMLKEPQSQLKRWSIATQIFIVISLFLILGGAISALYWDIQIGTLTSISSIITGAISTLLLRQLRQAKKDFEASLNKVLEQYKNALKQLYQK